MMLCAEVRRWRVRRRVKWVKVDGDHPPLVVDGNRYTPRNKSQAADQDHPSALSNEPAGSRNSHANDPSSETSPPIATPANLKPSAKKSSYSPAVVDPSQNPAEALALPDLPHVTRPKINWDPSKKLEYSGKKGGRRPSPEPRKEETETSHQHLTAEATAPPESD
jgi:hypothetical protein